MATNSENDNKISSNNVIKKPFIKNNTLMIIIILIGVIAAGVVFAMQFIKNNNTKEAGNVAEIEWMKISDYITDMIEEGELNISYVDSSQRKKLIIAGKDVYYSIQHNGNILYFWQGNYPQTATTDEMKITEAQSDNSNAKRFSENVMDFSVENYNQGTNTFSDGTVKIRLRVEKDGKIKQDSFVAKIPEKN